jgi:hypothetical protein
MPITTAPLDLQSVKSVGFTTNIITVLAIQFSLTLANFKWAHVKFVREPSISFTTSNLKAFLNFRQ